MNISLTPQLEEYLKQKVKGGSYHSVSEVVREGLRELQRRDEEAKQEKALNALLEKRLTEVKAGEKGIVVDKNYAEDLKQRIKSKTRV